MLPSTFIAVHGGAGAHNRSSDQLVKQAIKKACQEVINEAAKTEKDRALSCIEGSIVILEDDESSNAGYGSNLTLDGTVECDASIMDGLSGDFGSVGCVPCIKNPISAARAVLEYSRSQDKLGRVPPLSLTSAGALQFAKEHGIAAVDLDSLVSPRALQEWKEWKKQLDNPSSPTEVNSQPKVMQDTVGAVACSGTSIAAGVSSGGLLLKIPGRIGEAAVYGAGCWASDTAACSVSGTGEYIVRAGLARLIVESISKNDDDVHGVLERTMIHSFWEPMRARGIEGPQAGILLLYRETSDNESEPVRVRLWCAFTTESMAIGYASTDRPVPKTKILRRPARSSPDATPSIFITSLPI